MDSGCKSSYYNRMYKIVEESLDAALYICNNYMDKFTIAKIFDVFDQIFSTAFILGTGYWIFFVGNHGAPLCICGRFGLACRHVRSKSHWIDLQPIAERSENIVFAPKIQGAIIPKKYNICIDSSTECGGYLISINLDLVHTKKIKKEFHVNVKASYGYVYPCYGPLFSIRFTPNPVLKSNYGKYLERLRIHRAVLMDRHYVDDLIVTPYSMPSTALILVSINLPKYDSPDKISAVFLADWEKSRNGASYRDVTTQTNRNNEHGLYKKASETFLSSIWNYKEGSALISREFPESSLEKNLDQNFPLGIDNSEQYDKQFPNMKNKSLSKMKQLKNHIREDSIPKPILTSSIQININDSSQQTIGMELPNFEEAFQTSKHVVKPQYSTRRRGRPKAIRCDGSRTFETSVRNVKSAVSSALSHDSMSPIISQSLLASGDSMEETSTNIENSQSLAEFDEIIEQVNQKCKFFSDEDFENELDLINQLITEKMQNDLIGLTQQ